jgi:DNA polymerase-1
MGLPSSIFEDARPISEEIAVEDSDRSRRTRATACREHESLRRAGVRRSRRQTTPVRDPPAASGSPSPNDAAIEVGLDTAGIKEALADPALPKDLHDLKAVLRALEPHNVDAGRHAR